VKIINKNYDINEVQRKIGGEIVRGEPIFFPFFRFLRAPLKRFRVDLSFWDPSQKVMTKLLRKRRLEVDAAFSGETTLLSQHEQASGRTRGANSNVVSDIGDFVPPLF